ncbi:hypothetical protein OG946_07675 [Streptomyces sp. NBC_01808]|uniref:hypothetical protein n=1 Tax=Streptomyces sp. NBC_01808 TaxID=2975947 RepID=UPI002DD974AF|nr:hypothetical protein [Streptomyces sp. NBC_01808]WSA37260.1 hypothetical protein OG946_07675 [Streptomyces sp. NBC_01808]
MLARLAVDGTGPAPVLTVVGTAEPTAAAQIAHLLRVGEIHHGTVNSHAPDGRTVVTRPGSCGDEHSLVTIARSLRPAGYRPAPA